MKYKDIIKEKDKEKLKILLFKYIDISNFDSFLYFLKNNDDKLYQFFLNVNNNLIDLYVDKDPLIFDISCDNVINITGETGSGKSTYVKNNFNDMNKYEILETDVLFNENIEVDNFLNNIRNKIFKKYSDEHYTYGYNLKINFNHFNDVLKIIMNEKNKISKTLVIDSGQFRHLKNYNLLKGKLIIIRTSVREAINRACKRFLEYYPNASEKEIEEHKIKKYTAYELYKKFNTLIIKSYILYKF